MNVLGIDPAQTTGWAFGNDTLDTVPRWYGVWTLNRQQRLVEFRDMLRQVCYAESIGLICYEAATFGSHNPAVQASHNEMAGVLKLFAADLNIEVRAYNPGTIKKWLTGNGAADKAQMIRAVKAQFGIATKDDNIADAVAICAMGLANYVHVPAKQTKRATKARKKKDARLF